jgi:tRNA ligase
MEMGRNRTTPPYKPGSPFFFKVKFDEPYMMYRDWREVTMTLLSTKGQMEASSLPKSKMRRNETKVYVEWVVEEITKNRASFHGFAKGKGIIATREKFLETKQGMEALAGVKNEKEKDTPEVATDKYNKTIIVPVAISGCGAFSISISYFLRSHLFLQNR